MELLQRETVDTQARREQAPSKQSHSQVEPRQGWNKQSSPKTEPEPVAFAIRHGPTCASLKDLQAFLGKGVYWTSLTWAQLFNLCQIQLQRLIDPGQHVMSTEVLTGDRCWVHVHCHLLQHVRKEKGSHYWAVRKRKHFLESPGQKCNDTQFGSLTPIFPQDAKSKT